MLRRCVIVIEVFWVRVHVTYYRTTLDASATPVRDPMQMPVNFSRRRIQSIH